jgi:nucleotide-binding universal stress UspA family protein
MGFGSAFMKRSYTEEVMFKYILVSATGADSDAPVFATALAVARPSAAHLAFLHVRADPQTILTAMINSGDDGSDYMSAADALARRGAELHRKAERAFREFCEREKLAVPGEHSLDHPSAEWKLRTGDEVSSLIEYGRAADLLVLGRGRDGETVAMETLEACLVATGRPVLIAPAEAPSRLTGTIAIAWKNRAETARAVAAALPLIEMAEQVIILSVEEGMEIGEESGENLRDALAWHNPNISVQRLQRDGRAAVETLLAAASGAKADLLVMGGYGHSRVREVIFGGFTRSILNAAQLPVLMVH